MEAVRNEKKDAPVAVQMDIPVIPDLSDLEKEWALENPKSEEDIGNEIDELEKLMMEN